MNLLNILLQNIIQHLQMRLYLEMNLNKKGKLFCNRDKRFSYHR